MIRNVFQPTFGNISDWECSHCGQIWESGQIPRICPNCRFEEILKILASAQGHAAKTDWAIYN